MAAAAGMAKSCARRRSSLEKLSGSAWPTDRKPRVRCEATKGTQSQERRWVWPLNVCQSASCLVSVGEEDTLLASQDSLQKGDSGVERQGIVRTFLWAL